MIPYFKFLFFFTPAHIFAYLETPPMQYALTFIPKQFCRKDMDNARGSNVCCLNSFMSRHKLIQESVSINKSCKSWFLNFIGVLDHSDGSINLSYSNIIFLYFQVTLLLFQIHQKLPSSSEFQQFCEDFYFFKIFLYFALPLQMIHGCFLPE